MAKARPRTGDARETKQPLKIDRLPPAVHEAILHLRNKAGKTWQEIESQSGVPYSKDWQLDGKGFVDWDEVSVAVLELFPEMYLPHSSLHRWYDLRVAQVQRDVLARSAQAREIAEAFSASVVANSDEAVVNAARDTILSVLAEDGTAKGRISAGKALLGLAEVMQKVRTNDIRERKVAVEEQTLQMKLDLLKQKAGQLIQAAEADDANAAPLTREQIIAQMKEIYGVA